MRTFLKIIIGLCLTFGGLAEVGAYQDPEPVKLAVEDFLRSQTAGLPGKVSYSVGALDPANQLAPCGALTVAMAGGAKPWGRTTVVVRCQSSASWNIFLPVTIHVLTNYLVAAAPIAQGQTIKAIDIGHKEGDLADLPSSVLTEEKQAVGRTTITPIGAGKPLRAELLKQAYSVLQNQSVKVVSEGSGFSVSNEGRALNNGVEGQVIQVRLQSGQIVSGIARAGGIVAVNF